MTNHSGAFRNLARYTTPEVVLVINNFLTNNTSIYGQVRVNVISQLRLPIKLHTQARTHAHTQARTHTHTHTSVHSYFYNRNNVVNGELPQLNR